MIAEQGDKREGGGKGGNRSLMIGVCSMAIHISYTATGPVCLADDGYFFTRLIRVLPPLIRILDALHGRHRSIHKGR